MPTKPTRIGLIAGWGDFPVRVAESLRDQGHEVYCMAIKGHADPVLEEICAATKWIGIGSIGRCVRFCRKHQVQNATMAGKVHKVKIFDRYVFWNHCPDWLTLRTFFSHMFGTADCKDDTLLLKVVNTFASQGVTLLPATDFSPELLVKDGQLSGKPLSNKQQLDVAFGWELAKQMGGLDVGQSVVVKTQTAIAIEAVEGTDQCIKRAGELCGSGNMTLVKVSKPNQDMRFDVPTIGLGTVESMHAAGIKALVIESGLTIIVDQQAVIDFANKHGISIIATSEACIEQFTGIAKVA
ncbi:MAG: LpxI family protein [Pirellulales bacterium]